MPRTREELPVARRVRPSSRRRELPIGPVVLTAAIAIGGGLGALVLLRDELQRRFLGPLPVPGIAARLDPQGRLLGHFPYPEAPTDRLVEIASGFEMDRDAGEAFQQMRAAAATDGIDLRLISAFRSIDMQKQIFFGVKSERNQTVEERARVSAPPGFSEHSTGYAIDLGDGSLPATNLSASFETTPAYVWLQQNAARFHFQLSFPRQNRQGVSYEPWHWRFEGTGEALRQFAAAHRLNGR